MGISSYSNVQGAPVLPLSLGMLMFVWCQIYSKPSGALQTCPQPPLDPQGGSHSPTCWCWPPESCVSLLAEALRACSAMGSLLSTGVTF